MELVAVAGGSAANKATGIAQAFPELFRRSVVDVGCRGRELRAALEQGVRYIGVDLGTTGDVQADLGRGLPLRSNSVATVVALDVLEHTDDIHTAFGEPC